MHVAPPLLKIRVHAGKWALHANYSGRSAYVLSDFDVILNQFTRPIAVITSAGKSGGVNGSSGTTQSTGTLALF